MSDSLKLVIAVLVPMRHGGAIDYPAADRYLEFLWSQGVRSILVNGTTGEFASFTMLERKHLLAFYRRCWKGELLVNISSPALRDCVVLLTHAREREADGVVVLPPYYFHGSIVSGVSEFLVQVISEADRMKVWLYDYPLHTGTTLTPELVRGLAGRFPNLVGIKCSGRSVEEARAFVDHVPRLQVLIGSDAACGTVLANGFAGWVSGGCNPIPKVALAVLRAQESGDTADRLAAEETIQAWSLLRQWSPQRTGYAVTDIAAIKAGMGAVVKGFEPHTRLPILPVPDPATYRDFVVRANR